MKLSVKFCWSTLQSQKLMYGLGESQVFIQWCFETAMPPLTRTRAHALLLWIIVHAQNVNGSTRGSTSTYAGNTN